jgi:hypothetical protein
VYKENRTILIAKIITIRNNAKTQFASDLVDYINSYHNVSVQVKERIITVHGNLITSVFSRFILDCELMLLNNNIPDPDSSEFNNFIEAKFNSFWTTAFQHYADDYNEKFYLLNLKDRLAINNMSKKGFMGEFKDMFKLAYKHNHKL